MRRGRLTPIALEIGPRTVRAAQLRVGRMRERLSAWACVPRLSEAWTADEAWRVRDALERQGFVGREALLVMPAADATASLLEFRGRSPREVDGPVVREELSRMHRLDASAFEYNAWPVRSTGRGRTSEAWLAVCTPHARAEALLGPLDAVGVQVLAVDAGCFALARAAWNNLGPSSLGVTAHLEHTCARFVAVANEGVIYERVLGGLGWHRVYERAHAQLDLDSGITRELLRAMARPEARRSSVQSGVVRLRTIVDEHMRVIAEELRQSLAYLDGGFASTSLAGLALSGEGATIGGWGKALQAITGLSPRVIGARDLVDGAEALPDDLGSELVLAIGLARHPQLLEEAA